MVKKRFNESAKELLVDLAKNPKMKKEIIKDKKASPDSLRRWETKMIEDKKQKHREDNANIDKRNIEKLKNAIKTGADEIPELECKQLYIHLNEDRHYYNK